MTNTDKSSNPSQDTESHSQSAKASSGESCPDRVTPNQSESSAATNDPEELTDHFEDSVIGGGVAENKTTEISPTAEGDPTGEPSTSPPNGSVESTQQRQSSVLHDDTEQDDRGQHEQGGDTSLHECLPDTVDTGPGESSPSQGYRPDCPRAEPDTSAGATQEEVEERVKAVEDGVLEDAKDTEGSRGTQVTEDTNTGDQDEPRAVRPVGEFESSTQASPSEPTEEDQAGEQFFDPQGNQPVYTEETAETAQSRQRSEQPVQQPARLPPKQKATYTRLKSGIRFTLLALLIDLPTIILTAAAYIFYRSIPVLTFGVVAVGGLLMLHSLTYDVGLMAHVGYFVSYGGGAALAALVLAALHDWITDTANRGPFSQHSR